MTLQLRMAITGVLMTSATVQAACTVGGGGQPPPMVSVTTDEMPIIAGDVRANSILITRYGEVPEPRALSNFYDVAPPSLIGGGTPLSPPPPPDREGGGNRCDSVRTNVAQPGAGATNSGDYPSSYLQRTPLALGLYRHLLEFDMTYVKDNPKNSQRSHWPVVAWEIPMNGGTVTGVVNLRVDYVGLPSAPVPGAQRNFSVYWQNTLIAEVPISTFTPEVELQWSADGHMLLLFDIGAANGTNLVQLPLVSTVMQGFQPSNFQYGRVAMPTTIRSSTGSMYFYSHLIESPPLP